MAYPLIESRDFVWPKGKVLFQKGQTYTGEFRQIGDAPEVNITPETEKAELFSSEEGANEKIDEVVTQKKLVGNMTINEPNMRNLALFFLGDEDAFTEVVQAVDTDVVATIAAAALDQWQDILVAGVHQYNLSNMVVQDQADVITYDLNDDYEIDLEAGMIRALSAGDISEDDELHLTYDTAALTHYRFDALTVDAIKGHIKFLAKPAKGKQNDVVGFISITPSGDMAQVGTDWRNIALAIEFINHSQYSNKALQVVERGAKQASA